MVINDYSGWEICWKCVLRLHLCLTSKHMKREKLRRVQNHAKVSLLSIPGKMLATSEKSEQ